MESTAAWLFDVDGVLTHPSEKRITQPQILDEIIKLLQKSQPVALITGRSTDWVQKRVIAPLNAKISDKTILQNLILLAEFGGVYLTFSNGQQKISIDEKIAPPSGLVSSAKNLVEQDFADYMFFDPTKKTIITFEINDGLNVEQFREGQKKLAPKLQELISKSGLDQSFIVHEDRLGTNIRNVKADKSYAVKDFLDWLKSKGISVQKFVAFGDSQSDVEMAQELYDQKLNFEFVFTGYKEDLGIQNLPFEVTFTKNHFEEGTLEYITFL